MASCPKCNAPVPEGTNFCTNCGVPLARPAAAPAPKPAPPPAAPPEGSATNFFASPAAPPKSQEPAEEFDLTFEKPDSKAARQDSAVPGAPPRKFEGLDLDLPPPELAEPELPRDVPPRRPSGAAGGAVCRFCKGPLNLEAGFCEYCGAPMEEAAPPDLVKAQPKPVSAPAAPAAPVQVARPPAAASTLPPPAGPPRSTAPPIAPFTAGATSAQPLRPNAGPPPASSLPPRPVQQAPPAAPRPMAGEPAPPFGVPPKSPQVTPPLPKPPSAAPAVKPATPFSPASALPAQPRASGPAIPTHAPAPSPPAVTAPHASPAEPTLVAPETPEVVPTGTKSGLIPLLLIAGILVLVAAAGVAAWYFVRVKPGPKLAPVVAAPESAAPQPEAPAAAEPTPAPEPAEPAPSEAPRPKATRTKKAAATAAGQPAAIAPTAQIAGLQNLSREAYAKGNYAEPAGANAISYSKQVLGMDPNNDYSKKLLENAVLGGKYQVQQAIAKKDLATAHRIANAMIQQLPNRSDVAGLKEDIAGAERATGTPKAPAATAGVSYRVYHMHTDKAPGDRGPYCAGTLSVVGDHLKFDAQSATDGQPHSYDFACSDVREIKKNARVGARQGGFHVRTTQSNYNFVPADGLSAPAGPLSSACSK